jgi:hypothetical protein
MLIRKNKNKIHETYNLVENFFIKKGFVVSNNCEYKITTNFFILKYFAIFLAQLLSHIKVFNSKNKVPVLVTEFNDYILFFLSFFLRFDNFFLINNHNIQCSNKNILRSFICIYLYKKINIVLLEWDNVDVNFNFLSITRIPFYRSFITTTPTFKNKIGILLSKNRFEKNTEILFNKYHNDLRFIYGNDNHMSQVNYINTSNYSNYLLFLDSIDILIINYSIDNYYLRTSGVISDAISRGVIIISPSFPIFFNQINIPCKFGYSFSNINEIDELIILALNFKKSDIYYKSFDKHRTYRGII